MRRNGLLVGGWAMATLLALVLGLQGIRSVSNSVTDHRPAPLSPSSVRAALQRTSTPSSTTTVANGSSASSASSATGDGPSGSVSSSDVVGPSVNGDDGPTASDGPSTSTNNNSATGAAVTPTTSQSSEPDAGATSSSTSDSSAPFEDRIYELEGGSVAVRFQDGAAHLLWATPNRDEGYRTDQAQDDGGTVDVRFRNDEHESRLRAYWDNGPRDEIEEQRDG